MTMLLKCCTFDYIVGITIRIINEVVQFLVLNYYFNNKNTQKYIYIKTLCVRIMDAPFPGHNIDSQSSSWELLCPYIWYPLIKWIP